MAADFAVVAITPEMPISDEAAKITALLRSGAVERVHLRHPPSSASEQSAILAAIPRDLLPRVRIHDHYGPLLERFPSLGGCHVGSRAPQSEVATLLERGIAASASCHSAAEVEQLPAGFDGCTLSPVFPSISKNGYCGCFSEADLLRAAHSGKRVIALGGITPSNINKVKGMGFAGAALLGWIWQGDFYRRLRALKMATRFGLQYITNSTTPEKVALEVEPVLRGGCKWVQIRMKDADDSTVAEAVRLVRPMAQASSAILLLDDRVQLAADLDVDGVHLGLSDMPPAQARQMLPPHAIIGSTANTLDHILGIAEAGASDYIGLGPLRFTTTKKNLSPTLGYEGYERIIPAMRRAGIDLPVAAIGSVALGDCAPLLRAGVDGVAVSGSIRRSTDPQKTTKEFTQNLPIS